MQCLFLFRDALGHLPTAQELRRCGFFVSEAVLPAQEPAAGAAPVLAFAAEPPAVYGPAQAFAEAGAEEAAGEGDGP